MCLPRSNTAGNSACGLCHFSSKSTTSEIEVWSIWMRGRGSHKPSPPYSNRSKELDLQRRLCSREAADGGIRQVESRAETHNHQLPGPHSHSRGEVSGKHRATAWRFKSRKHLWGDQHLNPRSSKKGAKTPATVMYTGLSDTALRVHGFCFLGQGR